MLDRWSRLCSRRQHCCCSSAALLILSPLVRNVTNMLMIWLWDLEHRWAITLRFKFQESTCLFCAILRFWFWEQKSIFRCRVAVTKLAQNLSTLIVVDKHILRKLKGQRVWYGLSWMYLKTEGLLIECQYDFDRAAGYSLAVQCMTWTIAWCGPATCFELILLPEIVYEYRKHTQLAARHKF